MKFLAAPRALASALTLTVLAATAAADIILDWEAHYNGAGSGIDQATAMTIDGNGDVIVTGRSWGIGTNYDYATVKFSGQTGQQIWATRYNGPGNGRDEAYAVTHDAAGNIYVTGGSWGVTSQEDYSTLKYDGVTGAQLWVARYDGPHGAADIARAIAVDNVNGRVAVTGGSWAEGVDYFTIKYNLGGGVIWGHRWTGAGVGTAQANAIAFDSAGHPIVTGSMWRGVNNGFDFCTVKINSATGFSLWFAIHSGPANGNDDAWDLVLDANDDVYVTGSSIAANNIPDYFTVKYNGVTGAEIWSARYQGPAAGFDVPSKIVLDNANGVYVTGRSQGVGTDRDFATIKYRASDGEELWVSRYDGPASGPDEAVSLATDNSNNVYVTGRSWGTGSDFDIATIQYDGLTGQDLSFARYKGPAGSQAAVVKVAQSGTYVAGDSFRQATGWDYVLLRYLAALQIQVDSFSIFRGILISGGLPELQQPDQAYLVVRPGLVLSSVEAPVQIVLEGQALNPATSELKFRVWSKVSTQNISQTVHLYDFSAAAWVLVDQRAASTTDSLVEVSVLNDPSRFIQSKSNIVRARLSYRQTGPTLTFPWTSSVDYAEWLVSP